MKSICFLLALMTFSCGGGDAQTNTFDTLCSPPCGLDVQEDVSPADVGVMADASGGEDSVVDISTTEDTQTFDAQAPDIETIPDSAPESLSDVSSVGEDISEVVSAPEKLKVLFIGNSYTYQNDLPNMVAQLSAASPSPVVVDSITKGGAWLQNHAADAPTIETIQTGGWTHVVLQEQSVLPVVASGTFIFAAADLSAVIHQAQAVPVFFETWARAEGNSLYNSDLAGYTPKTMQEELRFRYQLAATNNNGLYAPVGDAWEVSLAEHPEITLHSGDGSHPAKTGSFLAACVLYEILTETDATQTTWAPEELSAEDATTLRSVAHQTISNL